MSDEIRHGPLSEAGPACEPKTLFVQVMGKAHPEGQNIVLFDRYRGGYIREPAKEGLESLPAPNSVLHKWRWEGTRPVDIHLEIASESGEPIRLPLFESLWESSRQERYQDNIVQPVMPMALWHAVEGNERHALPLRSGYLYLFYREALWREIEVTANADTGQLEFRDIDLAAHRGDDERYQDDRRPAAGVALAEVWLPHRERERYLNGTVEIAFSEVQWSAARLNYLLDDSRACRTRCHTLNLSSTNDYASLGRLYSLSQEEPQRLRVPFVEQQVARPERVTRDLAGEYLPQLADQAWNEGHAFGDAQRAVQYAQEARDPDSLLYLNAKARIDALTALSAHDAGEPSPDDTLWQGESGKDCLTDASSRGIPGVLIADPLFALRQALSGCRASLQYLQAIPGLAAQDDFYECAALVNQTILPRQHRGGGANDLHRFAECADLSDTGELQRLLRSAQREVGRAQLAAYQSRLHRLLLSRETTALLADLFSLEGHDYVGAYALMADLLEALRVAPEQADALYPEPLTTPSPEQRFLVDVLKEGSGYTLHALLFPSDDVSSLAAPLSLPEEEHNPGDGRVRLKALAGQAELEVPGATDDIQLLETALLAGLANDSAFPWSGELKRWANAVDLIMGRFAEYGMALSEQMATAALAVPAQRLARVGLAELLGDVTARQRAGVPANAVILGVQDSAGGIVNGLSETERLTPARAMGLAGAANAIGDQNLTVLVAEPDAKAAQLSRRVRQHAERARDLGRATEAIRLPYVLVVFEFFNLRQELSSYELNQTTRGAFGAGSAALDLTIASFKVLEFYGERHNRLNALRTRGISREFPLGEALRRSQSTVLSALGGQLRGVISVVNFVGVAAGLLTSALLAVDAWQRFQHGNLGAGIALSVAAASTAVVAGTALFKTSPLWLGLGPVGWIALGLSVAAVLASLWLMDNELEEWLRLGPFGTNERYAWRRDPAAAFDRLVSLFAGIRIRIDAIGLATPESVAADSARRPAIGVLSTVPPVRYVESLAAENALCNVPGPLANTRVVVKSNIPGLAEGWEQVAKMRFQIVTERKYEYRKDGYSQWMEERRRWSDPVPPLFERSTTDGREYYLWLPPPEVTPGNWWRAERRTRCELAVRVQWRQPHSASDALPRLLPAPGPTETPSVAESLQPDFERTDQPYWADETTHRDDRESHG
ncbi:hypothetical protein L861_12645 [Litchfieldella anticariensis FP35 = DSM 16096]|uniref:Toxin VasX N-terminal region domain-containing protein n=1 Tax=Litchfieldella anticariensis (strain DSM 16096 / CECT 5854 / CIP 108499 / LMG 22089 / FP35) TaxID=1121939 RepID=S2KFD9_LITA3|nr:toxin VasX [Halomonas anticariensis]EPC00635.1 hypothetical protein L861_12645 [Halomonas anticariensis FP35 = DSM 16096]